MGSEGRDKGRALCGFYCVPRLHPISYTRGTPRVGFSPTSRILFKSFFNKILSSLFGFFFFVLLLIGSSSKVQSTTGRCYRDTKVQDKVLPTTGRLF